jgi:uncharacterized protein DUF3455
MLSVAAIIRQWSRPMRLFACSILLLSLSLSAFAEAPESIAARGETHVATVHAIGAQIYECKADPAGTLTWQFREPIATLFADSKTVGRHYAGPFWEMADGSAVKAKAVANAPGASADDIPLLKLEVVSSQGKGELSGITTIQRLNTQGGKASGTCQSAGAFLSVPYTADYAFYSKSKGY